MKKIVQKHHEFFVKHYICKTPGQKSALCYNNIKQFVQNVQAGKLIRKQSVQN